MHDERLACALDSNIATGGLFFERTRLQGCVRFFPYNLAMKYTSTRSASIVASFEDVVCSGYAPDGGLFVPMEVPAFTPDELNHWAVLGYVDLAYEIFRRFIDEEEIPNEHLREICDAAFIGFEDPAQAVPVVKIGSLFISELFHGPTFCFKDLG